MKFRKDINGLRAFAVIAVVLFHFNASWMPGGFAGVDVFFVISGFLMTGIIFKGLENNNFSVLNFYVARANRIIPALAALCLALLVFGWFYLTPLEYKALGKHAASSVGFLSNVIYWREAGYFDAASHEKWLLHTWSLSVEWQFYIIYPLVLLVLKRVFSLKTLKSLIIAATVVGFIFSVYATYKWPSASYYLFPMRAWEMMLGGVAFLYPIKLQENNKRLVEILGLVLIVGSYVFITGDDPWPGYLALFPVLGTFLIIQAQRNESIITGNILFQKLGAWSYSIYLWHWPFVVAIYTFSLPNQYIYIGMALSVLLGYLSYKYIERIRFPRSFPTLLGYLKCKPIHISLIILIGSTAVFYSGGSPLSFRPGAISERAVFIDYYAKQEKENKYEDYWLKCDMYSAHNKSKEYNLDSSCINTSSSDGVLLWGDSHAQALSLGLRELFQERNIGFSQVTSSGCRPSLKPDIYERAELSEPCNYANKKALDTINQIHPKLIIIAQKDQHDKQDWKELSTKISKISDAELLVIGPVSQWEKSLPSIVVQPNHWKTKELFIEDKNLNNDVILTDQAMRSLAEESEFQYISLISKLCIKNTDENIKCRVYTNDQKLIQTDYGHLSREGSRFIVRNIIEKPLLNIYYTNK
ncbi:acyltransferase family protein [Psychrobacter sp. UBA3962]|uniref:acyltransferase family protein n=1 Tax=Psychrobacter sp. UBA3962 TaxID=1947352 RepID=UPI0025E8B203|nr:acyltransferase family protein [Psychrobacter sp. UBA3962]